jgi:hypothetical protein
MTKQRVNIIGFGAVGRAFCKTLQASVARGMLPEVESISYWAPEIKEFKKDGIFTFNPTPLFSRENINSILDQVGILSHSLSLSLSLSLSSDLTVVSID